MTSQLIAWSKEDETARAEAIEEVYGELRRLARGSVKRDWAVARAWLHREVHGPVG